MENRPRRFDNGPGRPWPQGVLHVPGEPEVKPDRVSTLIGVMLLGIVLLALLAAPALVLLAWKAAL